VVQGVGFSWALGALKIQTGGGAAVEMDGCLGPLGPGGPWGSGQVGVMRRVVRGVGFPWGLGAPGGRGGWG
jgi:hypothetical protein